MKYLQSSISRAQRITGRCPLICQSSRWLDRSSFKHATALFASAHPLGRFSQHTSYYRIHDTSNSRPLTTSNAQIKQSGLQSLEPGLAVSRSADSTAVFDSESNIQHTTTVQVEPKEFPLVCPGCGAYSQTSIEDEPGYYTTERNDVKLWVAKQQQVKSEEDKETDLVTRSLGSVDPALLQSLGISAPDPTPKQRVADTVPVCGRCHALLYHNDLKQRSIIHPTIDTIRAFLDESPHRRNHIYHVLDAADFPMSLIPNISSVFDIAVRSKNRRAKSHRWAGGQNIQMSFIITRADLIAHSKKDLDQMMPYLQDVLRDALGRYGENIRLGNVWCVSARQAWWTKQLKDEIYQNGGGGWLVGKVNVGKSQLYEAVFPKGYKENSHKTNETQQESKEVELDISHQLLPPLPEEEKYPPMPTVSQLPGTTALPVRNLYGNGRGELVDLPGLPRDGLYEAVNPETAPYLYHARRISAEQITILPGGHSLLISNLIQIKPTDPSLTILAAAFVPMRCSARSNDSATSILNQTQPATTAENIARNLARSEIANTITSAGTFKLAYNVTKERSGPLMRHDAASLSLSTLPFVIFGADLLIEGVGWVELSCQVRKRYIEELGDPDWRPEVEVFSPYGKYIGIRRPMNAYLHIGGARPKPKSQRTQRPRRSMKGVKKEQKRLARIESK
ncbi:MAG: hypothetical protein GOMPHAMPRED_005453 [Gomphillus americanus]|uniref:Genetic interactor of prohibitins 3, mitochondrial n=1 Tax=Gomphillus americanus TaxID=1940652 RepID=A0A8H3FP82_9LECA|nr:MAG: hypothetical protein GOMPHAMPRED_005453 [Gomphillus americanus]